jgi:YgiT-type zinc finger domain-containing protein
MVCRSGTLEEQSVETWMQRGDRWVLFRNVPALVCDICGDRNFAQDVAERLTRMLAPDSGETPTAFEYMPVFDLAAVDRARAEGSRPVMAVGTEGSNLEPRLVESGVAPAAVDQNTVGMVNVTP